MQSALLSRYQEETNKKLLYARLSLELIEQVEEPYIAALKESCLWHLIQAYDALVNEIQARLNRIPQPNLLAIVPILKQAGSYAAEINLLTRLEEDSSSWLNKMRRKQNKSFDKVAAMQLIEDEPLTIADLSKWLVELEKLCHQLRDAMTEY